MLPSPHSLHRVSRRPCRRLLSLPFCSQFAFLRDCESAPVRDERRGNGGPRARLWTQPSLTKGPLSEEHRARRRLAPLRHFHFSQIITSLIPRDVLLSRRSRDEFVLAQAHAHLGPRSLVRLVAYCRNSSSHRQRVHHSLAPSQPFFAGTPQGPPPSIRTVPPRLLASQTPRARCLHPLCAAPVTALT